MGLGIGMANTFGGSHGIFDLVRLWSLPARPHSSPVCWHMTVHGLLSKHQRRGRGGSAWLRSAVEGLCGR